MIDKTFPITENLLNFGLSASQKLLELLNAETQILAQPAEHQALTAIAAGKREVVEQLEQFALQLGQVLATEQLVANHQGIEQYLNKAQAAGSNVAASRANWANITALSKKCRSINEQNGASIDMLSRHTQRALQILKGKSSLSTTYGRDGTTRSEQFSQRMISV